jgi:arylsulfatase A-like enzyme
MNVYLLNASRSPLVDGFSTGYAENVKRVDRCFGEFIAHLKKTGIYDNSIIVVTSDHGESLGENGNYGHQFFLFPEDIRVPLIMSIPAPMRGEWSTDIGRVAFSMDIVPTLYKLLGYDVRDLGEHAGSPLVTTPEVDLPSRRRQPFIVMSSYGASYGVLRRNGRFLFISDLINYREYAFDLFKEPLGEPARVTDDLRRVNQQLIRTHVATIEDFFKVR